MQSKTWMDEVEEKKRGWTRDPNGGWIRENPSVSINSNMNHNMNSLPKSQKLMNGHKSNSLWNRRRTSSTTSIPTLPIHDNSSLSTTYHKRSPTITQQRGSSASPQSMPHAKGFWVQEPDDLTQRWVPTDHGMDSSTPKMHAPITSMMWPSTGKQEYVNGGRPPVSGHQKSGSPMVRSPELPANNHNQHQPPVSLEKAGSISMSDGDENIDIANRIKRFQQPENQQAMCTTSRTSTSTSTSSSSQQMKRSHLSSNSHSSSNLNEQIKASKTKSSSNVSEMTSTKSEFKSSSSGSKSNMSEIKTQSNSMNFSRSASKSTLEQSAAGTSPGGLNKLQASGFGPMGSLEALAKAQGNGLAIEDFKDNLCLVEPLDGTVALTNSSPHGNPTEVKFEESKSSSSSKTKVVTDNNSYESASGHESESRKVQSGDVSYEESRNKAATKSKLEIDGITAEKAAAVQNESRQLKAGDISIREGSQIKGGSMSISGNGFSANKSAVSEQQQRQMVTPAGTINQESSRKASRSGISVNNQMMQTSAMASSMNNTSISVFEDFDKLTDFSQPHDVQNSLMKFSSTMSNFVDELRGTQDGGAEGPSLLENINYMIKRAWNVPSYGHELGSSLCSVMRHNGGLDVLMQNCKSVNDDLKFTSAKVLEQCLTTENRNYVVEKDLETVVGVACDCSQKGHSVDESRVGTGILEHLFKHSEGTCSDIIKLGGLDAVIKECRNTDKDTLQHCAGALANLSLYGGTENQKAMMKQKVEHWLFPLAFHEDDNIKYYACLAIAALVANKEIEAAVLKSGSLSLVEPFVSTHLPEEFANSTEAHKHGQSKSWLKRLVPVLRSNREEACNLAAFHFCMEAGIKKKQGNLEIFREIKAIESLKEVASSPNAIASKYAAQALTLMGEEVPHKLTQQVPIWSIEDVSEWVKRIGFGEYEQRFRESRVDGDLLLRMNESNLKDDIQIKNGILRQRFARELKKLKIRADYSSCDDTQLNDFLLNIDSDYTEYTYPLLQSGVSLEYLRYISDDHTLIECGIHNPIHRNRIRNAIIGEDISSEQGGNVEKCLDVFISYRRSNGSQLASLLKVHMSLRSFSVFIDVERLEAGKFDNNLLNSIRQAKNFLLVLSANALDRCVGDEDCKDWVHREIVAAIQSGCNIIPILDNFQWPEPENLPEDMRSICYFNGVRWIHDYQDACVDKLERFMRGEGIMKELYGRYAQGPTGMITPGTPSTLPRGPPMFQRTTSIESGKGSSCSDKDFARD